MADPNLPYEQQEIQSPETLVEEKEYEPGNDEPWKTILFNDEHHGFEEVIVQVMKAVKCDFERAKQITLEAHFKGKSIAKSGEFEECLRASNILEEINLKTEIQG
jgi:ATP-dependent Clp protease adapter protein ClpS